MERTLDNFVGQLLGVNAAPLNCPAWPPDLFAVCGTILHFTGGYLKLATIGDTYELLDENWIDQVRNRSAVWRESLEDQFGAQVSGEGPFDFESLEVPAFVDKLWQAILEIKDTTVADLFADISDEKQCKGLQAVLQLAALSDETSGGIGISTDDFFLLAAEVLCDQNNRSSYSSNVVFPAAVVLPKQHTPQRGFTLRSLTHNLSLHLSPDVFVVWRLLEIEKSPELLNVLLIPWPFEISSSSFEYLDELGAEIADGFSYFSFVPDGIKKTELECIRVFEEGIEAAQASVGKIHMVVFPELALSESLYKKIESSALEKGIILVAGVGEASEGDNVPRNQCRVQTAGLLELEKELNNDDTIRDAYRVVQDKHHRWCLDRDQILQYGLGGRLPASQQCWEYIDVSDRSLTFVTMSDWLTLCFLVCEDLARQDPAAGILRSVGPNLVIALLMDGPQLEKRWSAKYASVLAEDPGSSVLTVTSLGLCKRSSEQLGLEEPNQTIGCWRDSVHGLKELKLPKDKNLCVLSLVKSSVQEHSLDGRGDYFSAHTPVFAGVKYL
ncbi:MAG: hypothetical protein AAFN07_10320 [Pseudomonadota bacterium]